MTVPGTEALHNERDKTMNPIVYAIPVFMLTILLEAWVARRRGVAVYDIPDAITSLHTDRKFNRMRPSMARVFGFETRRPRQTKAD
jgi:hypothetical protein